MQIAQERKNTQELASYPNHDDPKKNYFCVLQSRDLKEISQEIVIDMFQVFSINVYALLDPSATLSFVTPLVSMNFICFTMYQISPSRFQPWWVILQLLKKSIEGCPISLPNRVTLVDLVELDMLDLMLFWGWFHYMPILLLLIVELEQ